MKYTHLVPRKWGHSIHFDFRHKIPTDLVSYFGGKRQFQISLNNVSTRETLLVSQSLKILVQELFSEKFHIVIRWERCRREMLKSFWERVSVSEEEYWE